MKEAIILFLIAAPLTFVYGITIDHFNRKREELLQFKVKGFHLHHSLIGLVLVVFSIFTSNTLFLSVGLGIIVGHGFEELYFGHRNLKAILTFISKD